MTSDNPFEKPLHQKHVVIAIGNGYVQYKNIDTGLVSSNSLRWFLIDAILLSESMVQEENK